MKTARITLADQEFDLPPAPLHLLAELQEQGLSFTDVNPNTSKGIKALASFVHGGLLRKYPDIKFEFVHNNLDIHNVGDVVKAWVEVNNLRAVGESASGEAAAG